MSDVHSVGGYVFAGNLFALGLSPLGWAGFMLMWVLQAIVFWNGMETIRKLIDFCGPAVYVVMVILAGHLIAQAGWDKVGFDLSVGPGKSGWASITALMSAMALVVSYFSGPMLNFGDTAEAWPPPIMVPFGGRDQRVCSPKGPIFGSDGRMRACVSA